MPKCRINGKEVEVAPGATIIEAFQAAGEDLAYYCWHPALSVAGVCRMCMVSIEGNPRTQIACNTQVTEGMVISNQTKEVKDAVKWTLDFHLINHPLDCPICDQAGECGLQEFYMKHGRYEPEMKEHKNKKHKVVDLGPTVVLDSERCILCSRCVRFTDEITKTNELGIFNRGDRSEVGTFDGKLLDNKYSVNTVDICPVGALTSKDFRFKQRVWYLKDVTTVCNGCSTGCNVKVYYNQSGVYRVKPVLNKEVNGHWMCDEGRDVYKHVNKEFRLLKAEHKQGSTSRFMAPGAAAKEVGVQLKKLVSQHGADSVALVLTGQYTSEEYAAVLSTFTRDIGTKNIYHWMNHPEKADEFDGLLIRGDKNPNTNGLVQELEKTGTKSLWVDFEKAAQSGIYKAIVVAGPELQKHYDDFAKVVSLVSNAEMVVWMTSNPNPAFATSKAANLWLVPMKTFVEKKGTFVNHAGRKQEMKKSFVVVSEALTLNEAATLFAGKDLNIGASL